MRKYYVVTSTETFSFQIMQFLGGSLLPRGVRPPPLCQCLPVRLPVAGLSQQGPENETLTAQTHSGENSYVALFHKDFLS